MKGFSSRGGFTIIELLVVVIVIGVLAAAGIAKYQGFSETARQKTCCSNQTTIENAVAIWCTQNTALPENTYCFNPFRPTGQCMNGGAPGAGTPAFQTTGQGMGIAQTIRDNKVWSCPNKVQYYGSIDNVPTNWGVAAAAMQNPWALNYRGYYWFYAMPPNVYTAGTEPGNGSYYNLTNAYLQGTQFALCSDLGQYQYPGAANSAKYKHANRWR